MPRGPARVGAQPARRCRTPGAAPPGAGAPGRPAPRPRRRRAPRARRAHRAAASRDPSIRCRRPRVRRAPASAKYACTTSRTSVKSRVTSRSPASITGGARPSRMRAICRAKPAMANDGSCPGPMWLNGRARRTRHAFADRPLPAQRLGRELAHGVGVARHRQRRLVDGQPRGIDRAVDVAAARVDHAAAEARLAQRLEQVEGSQHVHAQRGLRVAERFGHVAAAREVDDRIRGRCAHGGAHRVPLEQVEAFGQLAERPSLRPGGCGDHRRPACGRRSPTARSPAGGRRRGGESGSGSARRAWRSGTGRGGNGNVPAAQRAQRCAIIGPPRRVILCTGAGEGTRACSGSDDRTADGPARSARRRRSRWSTIGSTPGAAARTCSPRSPPCIRRPRSIRSSISCPRTCARGWASTTSARRSCSACRARAGTSASCCRCSPRPSSGWTSRATTRSSRRRTRSPRA